MNIDLPPANRPPPRKTAIMPRERTAVTAIVDDLAAGRLELTEAARRFRTLEWRPQERVAPEPRTGAELLAAAENDDPPTFTPGSFDEVSVAHAIGRLDDAQYGALYVAWREAVGA